MFTLPGLPYAYEALEPVVSARTLHFHHDKHHAGYLKALNDLLAAPGKLPRDLEDVIGDASKSGERKLFNNAAQVWNHSFFWIAMSPSRQQPDDALVAAIEKAFVNLAGLQTAFIKAGAEHFGSGWVWLAADQIGGLSVLTTHDADGTLSHPGLTPLLVCDVWEHAYYLDHQNDRKGFLKAWFSALPNWAFAARQFAAARGSGEPWRHPAPTPDGGLTQAA